MTNRPKSTILFLIACIRIGRLGETIDLSIIYEDKMLPNQNALLRQLKVHGETLNFETDGLLFNAAIEPSTLAIVSCRDTAHLAHIVKLASENNVTMAAVAGGHDLSARGFTKDNLILDLRSMSSVSVDAGNMNVTLGGGTLSGDLIDQLPSDLVTPLGTVSSVGVVGLALGGGYGRLTSTLGLTSDSLVRAEVVLADGTITIASEDDDRDLLWALRGGGSGFGVVASCCLQLHRMPHVLSSMHIYPIDDASPVLLMCQDLLDQYPDDLNLFMGFMTGPSGKPVLFVSPTWTGAKVTGEALVNNFAAEPSAFTVHNGWMPYKMTFDKEAEKAWPKGRNYSLPTRTISRIDREVADKLVRAAANFTSPFSALVLHDFHGAPTKIASEATAFPLREPHFVIEIISAWDGDAYIRSDEHLAWAQAVSASLTAASLPGGYSNLLAPHETGRMLDFYGGSADRLREIKNRVDPRDLFRSGTGRLKSKPTVKAAL